MSLAASFPILISRILRKGVAGVSVTTHGSYSPPTVSSNVYPIHLVGLHLIIFLARYLDLWTVTNFSQAETWKEWFNTWYNPLVKLYLIHAASAVLIAFAYAHVRDNLPTRKSMANELKSNFFSSLKNFAVYVIPATLLAYRFHYGQHSYLYEPFAAPTSSFEPGTQTEGLEHVFGWFKSAIEFFSPADLFLMDRRELFEVAWSFSVYLSAIAEIPQYVTYYHYLDSRTSIDWFLMANMSLTALFRVFYIPHWVIRYALSLEHPHSPLIPVLYTDSARKAPLIPSSSLRVSSRSSPFGYSSSPVSIRLTTTLLKALMKKPTGTNSTPAGVRSKPSLVNGIISCFTPKDNHFGRRRSLSPLGSSLSFGLRMWTPIVLPCLYPRISRSARHSDVTMYQCAVHICTHISLSKPNLFHPHFRRADPIYCRHGQCNRTLLYCLQLCTVITGHFFILSKSRPFWEPASYKRTR